MCELIPALCLAIATIRGEADGEPFEGKVAVAKVLRNRMRLKYASDGTVAGTVLRPQQFSMWNTDDPNRIRTANLDSEDLLSAEAHRAWSLSKKQDFLPLLNNAVLYHTAAAPIVGGKPLPWPPRWAKSPQVKAVARLGAHIFYEDSGGK